MLTSGNSAHVVSPAHEHVADLERADFARGHARPQGGVVHQRQGQNYPGEGHGHVITGSFGNPQRVLDLLHRPIVGSLSTPSGSPGK